MSQQFVWEIIYVQRHLLNYLSDKQLLISESICKKWFLPCVECARQVLDIKDHLQCLNPMGESFKEKVSFISALVTIEMKNCFQFWKTQTLKLKF